MICIAGKLPILQVGRHQVCGYKTDWILEGLEYAAAKAGISDFPFMGDIYQAVKKYLEFDCALEVLTIEALNQRVLKMLEHLGLQHVQQNMPLITPPIVLSLEWIAKKSGRGFELGFFNDLKFEIETAKEAGASKLILEELKPAVITLTGKTKWDSHCTRLMDEIICFVSHSSEFQASAVNGKRMVVPISDRWLNVK